MTTLASGALARARTLLLLAVATLLAATALVAVSATTAAPADAAVATAAKKAAKKQARRSDKVMRVARAQAGDPYRYGASGPNAFDCSGYTRFVYKRAVGESLPHSSSAQVGRTKRISKKAARQGDLVFFRDGGGVYHVAIYAGKNRVWHAPRPGQKVHRAKIWTNSIFFGRVR